MDLKTFPSTKPLISCTPAEVPGLVKRLCKAGLAFGVGYFPENQSVKTSISHPDSVILLQKVGDFGSFITDCGFAVFPFDLRRNLSFFIPNSYSKEEAEVLSSSENAGQKGLLSKKSADSTTAAYYQRQVTEAVAAIKAKTFSKLVLSRKAVFDFEPQELETLLSNLFKQYPRAHLTLFYTPHTGLWISASPEILVQQSGKYLLKTMALAGTMAFHGQELKNQGWTEKEIEEQALVSSFVKDRLKEVGLFMFDEKGPATVEAGNLLHLRTDFLVHSTNTEDLSRLAAALHPTSAVCGSPATTALDWLDHHEGFDREYFSGCAGPIEPENSKLVVLLRAGKIVQNQLTLFAGAGITEASDPVKEWDETEEKLKTFLHLLPEQLTA